jgi:hypothetical protein
VHGYLSKFLSGGADPYWPHLLLLAGSITAGMAVAVGIVLESESLLSLATILVVGGVALESTFTFMLFGFDEAISYQQQATIEKQNAQIIALETRLAARSLSASQIASIVQKLRRFDGQEFDIVTYWKDREAFAFTNQVFDTLIKSGWRYDKPKDTESMIGVETGVSVRFDRTAGDAIGLARDAVVEALKENGVDAWADDRTPYSSDQPVNAIIISVGIRP